MNVSSSFLEYSLFNLVCLGSSIREEDCFRDALADWLCAQLSD
jgi:hypothetical protein